MADLRKNVLSKVPGIPFPSRPMAFSKATQSFQPLPWTEYFEEETKVSTSRGDFNVYMKGSEGPFLFCLHGGGYSGLTWALFAKEIGTNIKCRVAAIDLRGHGKTHTQDESDMSLEVLALDCVSVIDEIMKNKKDVKVVLIGHSMGGAVAVEVASIIQYSAGLCVIDVVEGTALEALSSMNNILRGRPTGFKSIEQAIQWCYKSGQTRNIEAARVSMPGQIKQIEESDICENISKSEPSGAISEETEQEEDTPSESSDNFKSPKRTTGFLDVTKNEFTWRIDLKKTEPFWTGWFQGLSQKFLDVSAPKTLLLANIHGLDTTLTVGQMQGKFQFQVLNKSGHAIHEDQPHQVAEIIATFLVKQKVAEAMDGFHVSSPFFKV